MLSTRQVTMVNGAFVDQLSVADRGLAFGDGLFETMRFVAGRAPLLEYHFDRLELGCRVLAIPLTRSQLQASFAQFVAAISEAPASILKLIITRGVGGQGCKPLSAQASTPSIIWQCLPLNDTARLACAGVTLQLCQTPLYANPLLAGLKHLNRLNYVLAALDLPEDTQVQGLLLDEQGKIVETLHHNIFFVKHHRLLTPRLQHSGVNGVLRRLIKERLASACALVVEEGDFSLDELLLAEEVFISNGVRGIWPVKQLADRQWQVPGPVTAKLQAQVEAVFRTGRLAGGEPYGQ